jgi:protein-tyrosine-phosphatase
MAKKLIEMVCTGNNGRSPVAELLARNYLVTVGAGKDYDSISSGTMVSQIMGGRIPMLVMQSTIELALEREGVYSPGERSEVRSVLISGFKGAIKAYFQRAADHFVAEEVAHRTEILDSFGIEGSLKECRNQTIVRPDVIAVLSMDRKNDEKVIEIYRDSKDDAKIIDVMSRIATGVRNAEIPNAFGQGKEVYTQMIEKLVKEVPMAAKRIIGA